MTKETEIHAQIVWTPEFDEKLQQHINERTEQEVAKRIAEIHQPIVYNLGEACKAAHCSYNTLYRWIDAGLPEIVYGTKYKRIKRTDLEAWLDKMAV